MCGSSLEEVSAFTPGTSFIAWAIRVAKFEIKDFVKARRRRKIYFTDALLDAIAVTYESEASEHHKERLEALSHCLEKLTVRDQVILKKCYAVDRDYRQIAESEGKSIEAIYKAISRIRKALYCCVQRKLATQ
jgi:RNA polymerase sigma-70 factor (ECF subfamily)